MSETTAASLTGKALNRILREELCDKGAVDTGISMSLVFNGEVSSPQLRALAVEIGKLASKTGYESINDLRALFVKSGDPNKFGTSEVAVIRLADLAVFREEDFTD